MCTEAVVPVSGRRSPAEDTITPGQAPVPTCTHHTASTETGEPPPCGGPAVPWPATHASALPTCVPSYAPTSQPPSSTSRTPTETTSYGCESRLRPHPQCRRPHRRRRSGLSSATRLSAYSLLLPSLPLYVLSIFVSVDPKCRMSSFVLRVLVGLERRHSAMSPLTAAAISAIVYIYIYVCVCVCVGCVRIYIGESSMAMCIYQGPGKGSPRICLTSGAYGRQRGYSQTWQ